MSRMVRQVQWLELQMELLVYHEIANKCIFKDFLQYSVNPEYVVDLHTNTVHLTDHSGYFFS